MPFIQILEIRTDDIDQVNALESEWERATEGKRTTHRSILTQDRNDPGRYLAIVFFDSYEAAMANSNLPETQEFAAKLGAVISDRPVFHDLDVLEDRT
jgi:quinol monooxygenase YgiN